MSHTPLRRATPGALVLGLVLTTAACGSPGSASVEITDFRLGPAPAQAQTRAGYLRVSNKGDRARTLVSATSNAYDIVEFHRTQIVNEVSTMRRENEVVIGAGEAVLFEPFGRHLMLMVPVQRPVDAPTTVTLCFGDGECIELTDRTTDSTP